MTPGLVQAVDALLPQTQCTRCGYQGCLPYATAISEGAALNQCPPGGAATIGELARLLGREALPLNPDNGTEGPPRVAVIDESRCIGCAKCLPPCPVDAIIGAPRFLHTVVSALCTGCELCIAPCPVDCISLVDLATVPGPQPPPSAQANRARYHAHLARAERRAAERAAVLAARKRLAQSPPSDARSPQDDPQ
jgi:electron transport complex protein RnfB